MTSFWLTPARWLWLFLLSLALSSYSIDVECLTQQGACHDYLFSQQYSDCVSPSIVDRPFCGSTMPAVLVSAGPSIEAPLGQEVVAVVLRPRRLPAAVALQVARWRLRGPPLAA